MLKMSESKDERPSFGGFGLGREPSPRRRAAEEMDEPKAQQPPAKKMKFSAANLMAQMGYKSGEGLGAGGQGRSKPIEVHLRPDGAGLGAVQEKTKHEKAQEQRDAALRGQTLDHSSEEERKRRREKKERSKKTSGQSTPSPHPRRPKFKTVVELESNLEGLEVPNVLKSLVDLNGKEATLSASNFTPAETDASRVAKRAQRHMEAFASSWQALQDEKKYHGTETVQLVTEMDRQRDEAQQLEDVLQAVQGLEVSSDLQVSDEAQWNAMTDKLEKLEIDFPDSISRFGLQEVAVAAIQPLFRRAMASWDPLASPRFLVPYMQRLTHVFGIAAEANGESSLVGRNGDAPSRAKGKATTTYETLIYTLWLPPVRRAVAEWDVENPTPLTELYKAWQPLLPAFVRTNFIEQLLIPRLIISLNAWKPALPRRHYRHRRKRPVSSPDSWLIEWLQYLPSYHHNASGSNSLLAHVKRKLRSLLASHDVAAGAPTYYSPWQPLLGSTYPHLLTAHLLPRLAAYLAANLVIDPSDQDLAPLNTVLASAPLFSTKAMAELLAAHFFPLFHEALHAWLTGTPNYDEIALWLGWWKEQLPPAICDAPAVSHEWRRAFETVQLALELGDRAATELPLPTAPTPQAIGRNSRSPAPVIPVTKVEPAAPSLRDVVEAWGSEEGLLLFPLRAAHPTNGAPLFRLTASASGKGGCVVYFHGDLLYVRMGREDSGRWEPMGLDQELIARAGG